MPSKTYLHPEQRHGEAAARAEGRTLLMQL
jgi:hypothetical protein